MDITDMVELYSEVEMNDTKRIVEDARAWAEMEAECSGLYRGYTEFWGDGFRCTEAAPEQREEIESRMNAMFVGKANELVREYLESESKNLLKGEGR